MYELLVGIDISKDSFSAAGINAEGREIFSASYEMNSDGFTQFLKTLYSQSERLDQVLVAMESTGCYHINLYSFLVSQETRALVVNPLMTSLSPHRHLLLSMIQIFSRVHQFGGRSRYNQQFQPCAVCQLMFGF